MLNYYIKPYKELIKNKMRKLIFTIFLASMLTSCVTYQGYYNVGLQEVERPKNAKERFGESKIINFEEDL